MSKVKIFRSILLLSFFSLSFAPAGAQNCTPRIDTASLLDAVTVDGSLYIRKFYAKCLPMPAKTSRTAFEYNPYDGGKFSSVLKDAGGQTINTYVWYGDHILSLWEFNRYEVLGGPEAIKKLAPGNYSIDFAIEDKVFQNFPFSVTTKESGDQFKPRTLYLLDGAWRDHARLYAPNVDRFIKLYVWLRNVNNTGAPNTPSQPVTVRLIREKDKQVLAETDADYRLVLKHTWQSVDIPFRRPGAAQAKDYSEFKLSEVVANDGRYKFEMAIDGKPYADYPFAVKNGRLNDVDLAQMRKDEYKIMIPLTATRRDR
jgi:hypothetical protein